VPRALRPPRRLAGLLRDPPAEPALLPRPRLDAAQNRRVGARRSRDLLARGRLAQMDAQDVAPRRGRRLLLLDRAVRADPARAPRYLRLLACREEDARERLLPRLLRRGLHPALSRRGRAEGVARRRLREHLDLGDERGALGRPHAP